MGQIQNALNQIFTSALGAGLAYQHSPYAQGQRAIKQFDAPIASAEETEEVYRKDILGDLKKDINKAKTLKELETVQSKVPEVVEDYKKTVQAERDLWKEQEDTILRVGTKWQKQEVLDERGGRAIENSPYWKRTQSYDEKAISSLAEAYEKKKGVLMSATQRRNMAKSQIPTELL